MPTTKKKTAAKTTKKTAPVKKAVPAEEVVKEEPAKELTDAEVEQLGKAIEKETLNKIAQDEMVRMIIPIDPRLDENHQFFEHCINGAIYRYPRGEEIEVPKTIAETLTRKMKMQRLSAIRVSQFTGSGKKLEY